jgi:transcription antitermination protein NusB
MKSPRRRAREFVLQALYQWQLTQQPLKELQAQYATAEGFDKADAGLFNAIVAGAIVNQSVIAEQLTPYLDRAWAEISPIEKAILLIGAYELSSMPETPYRVVINECIELAKSFGGTDGHKYVNGILDKFAVTARAQEIADPATSARSARSPVRSR